MSVIGEELRMLRTIIMDLLERMFGTIYQLSVLIKNYIRENTKIFFSGLLVFIWIIAMFYLFKYDPYKITSVYRQTSTTFSLIVLFLLMMTFTFVKFRKQIFKDIPDASKKSDYPSIFGFNMKLVLILIVSYFILTSFSRAFVSFFTSTLVKASLVTLVNGAIIAGVIALAYKLVASQLLDNAKKTKTGLLLFFNFLFYIPCTITKIFDYIHEQTKITPSSTWTILLIEFLVITFGFALPKLLTYFLEKKGMILLKDPVYINQEITLASAEDLEPKAKNSYFSFSPTQEHDYNYSISAWIRVNPQPPTGVVKTGDEPCNQIFVSGAGKMNRSQRYREAYKQVNGSYKLASNNGSSLIYRNMHGYTITKSNNAWIIQHSNRRNNSQNTRIELVSPMSWTSAPPKSGWKEYTYNNQLRGSRAHIQVPSKVKVVCIETDNEIDCERTNTCETITSRIDGYLPVITYGGNPDILYNPKKNKLEVRIQQDNGQNKIIYQMDSMPLQKWNHIVMNFDSGTLDLFINNKLVISKPNVLTRMKSRELLAGSDNGFEGGIRNVTYFPYTLSKQEIELFYNNYKKTDFL